jgi:hypothetical protein
MVVALVTAVRVAMVVALVMVARLAMPGGLETMAVRVVTGNSISEHQLIKQAAI